jgi:pyruvate carboxylase subunit B
MSMNDEILATQTGAYLMPTPAKRGTDEARTRRAIRVTETVLRDAHQSLLATRMRTEDMIPILQKLDQVGFWSVEMWGGATFDSCLRFLKEDPWERLRLIRQHMPNTRLQMLMRGQNILGYKHYPDDIVQEFVKAAANGGIDVFRIFDALNDVRNMKTAIQAVLDAGKIAEGAISYTVSPFHTIERYVELAKELEALGCQTICIKDMAGLLSPYTTYELVGQLKEHLSVPVHLHSHATSGMSEAAYLKAIEAGVDIVDTAISSMAGGTSQPPTESLVATLKESHHDTGLDINALSEIAEYFRSIRGKYAHFESKYTGVDPRVLRFQIPGGMISNLANQLREQDALDRMEEVLDEVPRVREDLGFPPLVTPTSQIVGTQAVLNVLMGERYKSLTRETRNVLLGRYGHTPAPCNDQLVKEAEETEGTSAITGRPADELEPMWDACTDVVSDLGGNVKEDALSYALFPQVAQAFFAERERVGPPPETVAAAMAAVIFQLRQNAFEEEDNNTNGRQAVNPWKWAGRLENMGIRSR